MQEIRILI